MRWRAMTMNTLQLPGRIRLAHCATFFALLVVSSLMVAGCRKSASVPGNTAWSKIPSDGKPHILVIGGDGMDWGVILPLIREGRMPHLEKLMQRGSFGKLRTYAPAMSPVIWTTIATGKRPEKHGIIDFFKPVRNNQIEFYTSADRRTKAVWNIVSDAGKRMVVVGWWNTYPAEDINGIIVAQTNTISEIKERRLGKGGIIRGVDGQVFPAKRQNEMLEVFAQVDRELPSLTKDIFGDMGVITYKPNHINWERSRWAFRSDEAYRRIALRLAAEPPVPDCFAVYFGVPDVVGHRFWRFHEPESFQYPPQPGPLKKFGHVIKDAYAHFDQSLGELLAAFPMDTSVIVLSDHGMHATNQDKQFGARKNMHEYYLESGAHMDNCPGVLVIAGPPIKPSKMKKPIRALTREDIPEIGSVEDITPTILTLLDIPLGRDMDGAVLHDLIKPAFARANKVRFVDTHDTPKWLASRRKKPKAAPGAAERIEQLRALGYLNDREDDKEDDQDNSQEKPPSRR